MLQKVSLHKGHLSIHQQTSIHQQKIQIFYRTWALFFIAAAAAKSLQLCPTLCDPIDGSPPGSPVPGILQARTLEWVTISFSNAWKWKVKVKSLSHVGLLATPWTAAFQAPPPMGFSRQEYWRKRNKRNPNWKRRSKALTVCRWHDPLHRKP